jgi:tRNA dimethylallyltransferase
MEANGKTERKKIIILTGPTSVGKTSLSIKLARELDGEIISADSMQVYKHMDIGTAKITRDEMQGVPHHLIDILEPTEEYNVARFKQEAQAAIKDIHSRERLPIIVGGTGFYIQALLYDVDFTDKAQTEYRKELIDLAAERGSGYLFDMLMKCDPAACEYISRNDVVRLSRALEYYHETGEQISLHNMKERSKEAAYDHNYFVLNIPREELYERINARVDVMIKDGLEDEVRKLMELGCDSSMTSMKGLGYKEILEYFNGNITLDEAVRIIKRDTRHFAKRQLTWFKREKDTKWINKNEFQYNDERIINYLLGEISNIN